MASDDSDLGGENDEGGAEGSLGSETTQDAGFDERAREASRVPSYGRGSALTDAEALEITTRSPTTVVVFAGPVGSGKTTLIAALYERFGRGSVGGHLFAGSKTLPGLEQRSYGGRIRSGRRFAEMPHTSLDALPWLHLRIRPADLSATSHDFLFGDFFGEHFDRMIAGTMKANSLEFMHRADHICMTLDGALLADGLAKQAQRRRALDLLGTLLDQGQGMTSRLSLVVTKWDRVHRAGSSIRNDVDALTDEIVESALERELSVELPVFLTAAKSTIRQLPLGHGLDELLIHWLGFPRAGAAKSVVGPAIPSTATPFERFHA